MRLDDNKEEVAKTRRRERRRGMEETKYEENRGPHDVLTPENATVLLIDHQVGLMNIVRDIGAEEFKSNVLGLARTARRSGFQWC